MRLILQANQAGVEEKFYKAEIIHSKWNEAFSHLIPILWKK